MLSIFRNSLGSSETLFENVSRDLHVTGRFHVVSNLKDIHETLIYLVKRYNS